MKQFVGRLMPKAKLGEFDKSSISLLLKVNQYTSDEIKDSFNKLKIDSLPPNYKLEDGISGHLSSEEFKKLMIAR